MLLPLYFISLLGFGIAADQFRIANSNRGAQPTVGVWPALFSLAGIAGSAGVIGMIVLGFLLGEWWWPAIGIVLTWIGAFLCHDFQPVISWRVTIACSAIGLVFMGLFFIVYLASPTV